MKRILVVGGAGYIGSHMVKKLVEEAYAVTVLDDLSSGHAQDVAGADLVVGSLRDKALLARIFEAGRFDAVMHFASYIQVGESLLKPDIYYENNVVATLWLLQAMVRAGVARLIFSSTAGVYGNPLTVPIAESDDKRPINPYGRSKWMVEQILEDFDRAFGLRFVALRYFNAAGAHPQGGLGERHDPETHLIPLVLQAASGRTDSVTVFGVNYDTPDGTCIRDYVHVCDIADAHALALRYLERGEPSAAFNLGNGQGFSVKQIIAAAERVTGKKIPVSYAPPRPGDPAVLRADSAKAHAVLKWSPKYSDILTIIEHAWAWEKHQHAALRSKENGP